MIYQPGGALVPGGRDIAVASGKLTKKYDMEIWAPMACSAPGRVLT